MFSHDDLNGNVSMIILLIPIKYAFGTHSNKVLSVSKSNRWLPKLNEQTCYLIGTNCHIGRPFRPMHLMQSFSFSSVIILIL